MRLSMSRQEVSPWGAAPASSGAAASRAQQARASRRCRAAPFSRMCARMPNHSTAPQNRAAPTQAALIDIGINLAHDSYDADRDAVLERAQAAGVVQMIITGSTLASTRRALELAHAHSGRLFATAGV